MSLTRRHLFPNSVKLKAIMWGFLEQQSAILSSEPAFQLTVFSCNKQTETSHLARFVLPTCSWLCGYPLEPCLPKRNRTVPEVTSYC